MISNDLHLFLIVGAAGLKILRKKFAKENYLRQHLVRIKVFLYTSFNFDSQSA